MSDFLFSPLISDGLIIQRDAPFPVWSSEKLKISFLGKNYESKQENGKWLAALDPAGAGGPFNMDIVCGEKVFNIQNIYCGDVWLCAGQSNMEMMMDRLRDNFSEEWKLAAYPNIRYFKAAQESDFSAPRENIAGGKWLCASKETLHEFSATAWFFAKKLHEKYKTQGLNIPIALINTAWGGTPVESWMSEEALADFPEKIAKGKQYADNAKRAEISAQSSKAVQEWETNLAQTDAGLAAHWENPQTDISGWDEMTLPGDFAQGGLGGFCGSIWFAKDFEVSASFAAGNAKVWLGTIVDADTVFINGKQIGTTSYRYPPRKYIPGALLKQGKNRIVIRVICNNGEGEITRDKPFRVFTDNESAELAGKWKYKAGTTTPVRPQEFFFQREPMGNFNAIAAPILKFPLKGVIWYQGESNDSYPYDYEKLFQLMIQDWRKKNGSSELPFLFVQLPIFGKLSENNESSSWALIREAQAKALCLPFTAMAAALEFGEWNDLHPLNKKGVGERLFLAAEKLLFNENNSSPGPIFRSFERRQNELLLYFDNCADGLETIDGRKLYLSVIDGDVIIRLPAVIKPPDVIKIDISLIKEPKKVLYAWAGNPRDRQLVNSEGLSAIPFRFDINI